MKILPFRLLLIFFLVTHIFAVSRELLHEEVQHFRNHAKIDQEIQKRRPNNGNWHALALFELAADVLDKKNSQVHTIMENFFGKDCVVIGLTRIVELVRLGYGYKNGLQIVPLPSALVEQYRANIKSVGICIKQSSDYAKLEDIHTTHRDKAIFNEHLDFTNNYLHQSTDLAAVKFVLETSLFAINVVQRGELQKFLSGYMPLSASSNVHAMDGYVAANIQTIDQFGCLLSLGKETLPKDEISKYFADFIDSNQGFYTKYEKYDVSSENLKTYINQALVRASESSTVLQLYSHITSVIKKLQERITVFQASSHPVNIAEFKDLEIRKRNENYLSYVQQLFDAISENYLTNGGCFEGVRNRAFIIYVSMLRSCYEFALY